MNPLADRMRLPFHAEILPVFILLLIFMAYYTSMNSFFRLLPLVTLFFFVAFLSPGVLAQSLSNNSYSNPQPFVLSGTNSITSTVAKGNQNIFSAYLRLTIPLLLVAAVILYIRSREKVTKRYYNPSTGYEIAYNQIKRKNRKFKFKRHLKAA